jgi:CBS domain-containing protein
MLCPACGYDNLPGADRCEDCLEPLMKLDVPQPKVGLQKRLMEDSVSHLSLTSPLTLSPKASLSEAIRLLKDHRVGCVLALEGNQLVGIMSERDLLYKIAGSSRPLDQTKLEDVMTANPVTLRPGDSIRFALHQMSVGGFRHIPVVTDQPVGIISIKDVLRYINKTLLSKWPVSASSHTSG